MIEEAKAEVAVRCARLRRAVEFAIALVALFWVGDLIQMYASGALEYGPRTAPPLRIADMPLWLEVVGALLRAIELIPVAGALFTLRRLLADWGRGEIYTPATASRVREIGVWLLLLAAAELFASVTMGPLAGLAGAAPYQLHLNLNLSAAAVGVVVLLLARILQVGAALQAQADLTF